MKKLLRFFGTVIISLIMLSIIGLLVFNFKMGTVKNDIIGDINLSAIPDGTYQGAYDAGRWSSTVEVTVEDHRIKGIKTLKDQLVPIPQVTGKLAGDIVRAQSLKVDDVSGATVTGKAYVKAVENALKRDSGTVAAKESSAVAE